MILPIVSVISSMEDHRLDRIEEKLDKLSEAVVCLARMEERLITIFNRLEKIEIRVDEVEADTGRSKHTIRFFERIFWIILSSGVATAFWYFKT